MNKSIFLLLVLLSLSFQKSDKPKTTMLFNAHLEVLNGQIKQLIETEHNHTLESESPEAWSIITDFDKKGNIISQKRQELWEKKWRAIRYLYKYNVVGKKTETSVKTYEKTKSVYKYAKDGVIRETLLYTKKNQLQGKEIYKYDKVGNMSELDIDEEDYSYKIKYLYDSKRRLIKEINEHGPEFSIEYKSFDRNGNWVKKMRISPVLYPLPNGKYVKLIDTIERKITYY
jgi:hypothetical protein